MPAGIDLRVHGIQEVRRILDGLDDEAEKVYKSQLLRAGDLLRNEGRRNIPAGAAPLSNWKGKRGQDRTSGGFPVWKSASDARKGIKTDTFRPRGGRGSFIGVEVTSRSAPAIIFDWAGQGGSSSTFVRNMLAKHGQPRRALLKAQDDKGEDAARKAAKAIQRALYDYAKRKGLR